MCGAPFNVVLFQDEGQDGSRKLAVVFDERAHCAVLDVAKLHAGDIVFRSNSWRGDVYEATLREAIKAWEHELDSALQTQGPEHRPECQTHEAYTDTRTHICDISLNGTRASVFEVADQSSARHEVELETPAANSSKFAYFDFVDVSNTTAAVLEHLRRGHSLSSFIAAHVHDPGQTPEVMAPQQRHEPDHEITR
jgi:hypothetical protein